MSDNSSVKGNWYERSGSGGYRYWNTDGGQYEYDGEALGYYRQYYTTIILQPTFKIFTFHFFLEICVALNIPRGDLTSHTLTIPMTPERTSFSTLTTSEETWMNSSSRRLRISILMMRGITGRRLTMRGHMSKM